MRTEARPIEPPILHRWRRCILSGALVAVVGCAVDALQGAQPSLRKYPTRYYLIHSDLAPVDVHEAGVRLTVMAELYHRRTRNFAGVVRQRLPVYLYRERSRYYAAGGVPGSAGVYTGDRLMAHAAVKDRRSLWHALQHEGFHQFAHQVIQGPLPIWVNEGLAEYFGDAIWTGDGMVTGIIPSSRLRRVKEMIRANYVLPFLEMLRMEHETWNQQLASRNYDQAWSMTHFLVHADDGKYRKAFEQFISDVASGRPWEMAFVNRFGRDIRAFERRYAQWWLSLPEEPSKGLYASATAQTLTSFLARAHQAKQRFTDFSDFAAHAEAGTLQLPSGQWLPPSLAQQAIRDAAQRGRWTLELPRGYPDRSPRLRLELGDGASLATSFRLVDGRVSAVDVRVLARPEPQE
jgi:uncharacterized protein DUF1570